MGDRQAACIACAAVDSRPRSARYICRCSGEAEIRFRLFGYGDLPTCGGRRRVKGEKASPLTIPGLSVCRLPGKLRAPGHLSPAGSHTPSMA